MFILDKSKYAGLCSLSSTAQQQSNLNQQLVSNYGYGTMVELKDVNGRPIINKQYDPDIKGSPFLIDDWSNADLTLVNGKLFMQVKIKLNVENNELNYLDSAHNTVVLNKGIVRKVIFYISKADRGVDTLILRNGYAGTGKMDSTTYYQVLVEGVISLLKLTKKSISILKNDNSIFRVTNTNASR